MLQFCTLLKRIYLHTNLLCGKLISTNIPFFFISIIFYRPRFVLYVYLFHPTLNNLWNVKASSIHFPSQNCCNRMLLVGKYLALLPKHFIGMVNILLINLNAMLVEYNLFYNWKTCYYACCIIYLEIFYLLTFQNNKPLHWKVLSLQNIWKGEMQKNFSCSMF